MGCSSCYTRLQTSFLEDKTQRRRKEQQRYEEQVLHLMLTLRSKFTAGATLVSCSASWRNVPASGCLGHGFNQTAGLRVGSTPLQVPPLYVEMCEREKK